MPPEIDLFAAQRGSVTAPAGCGKTQLISDSLALHTDAKPILILTHTNAGVAALKGRLKRGAVASSAYRVSTLDGFALRLLSTFPQRSGVAPLTLELRTPAADYPQIRNLACALLSAGHVNDVLSATYSRVLVDEYQDCNLTQHAIVTWLAQVLPTYVLGDPMQAIFNFGGTSLVDWNTHVLAHFPALGELRTPWRWRRVGTEALGNWLLQARAQLQAGQQIDLTLAPPEVQWVRLDPLTAVQQRLVAARTVPAGGHGNVLIIGDSRNVRGRHQLTSQTPGATSVETVDLAEMVGFCRTFNPASPNALDELVNFASSTMTGVGPATLLPRIATLRGGRARTEPTPVEAAAVAFAESPSMAAAATMLEQFTTATGTRLYRPEVLRGCVAAMRTAASGATTLEAAALQTRERNRHQGRPLSGRAVGSTLLLKGLESDVAVILEPEGMSAQNLYVALTRGARQLVVCSTSHLLGPRQ